MTIRYCKHVNMYTLENSQQNNCYRGWSSAIKGQLKMTFWLV